MANLLRVLFAEDSENDAKLLLLELQRGGWEIVHARVDSAAAMKAALEGRPWDLIIADYSMPSFSGLDALEIARSKAQGVPFILVSGNVGEETAVQAMKAGADDYLFKGNLRRLVPAVERELRDAEEQRNARQVERQLHARDVQLNDAQRLAHLGTWHIDLRTGKAAWSDEACRILGADSSGPGVTYERFIACMHPDDKVRFQKTLAETTATAVEQDCRLVCAGMPAQFVHIRGEIHRDDKGSAIEATGMIQDITERHRAEEQVEQAREAAEHANRAKSEFLANMSHEIRTPITAILGFSDMMLQPNQDPRDRTECIQTVRRNAAHLLELINAILDISKIEAGRMTIEQIDCELTVLLSDLIGLMRPRALEKGLKLEVSFDGPIPRTIKTDPLRLRQILVNLVGNALKFTAAGKIHLRVHAQATLSGNMLYVEVIDTGIGLTREQMGRLFSPFTQAEESTTRKFGGTGLGLTISQQMARLMGGQITVSSEPGVGSNFTLCINGGTYPGEEMLKNMNENMLPKPPSPEKWHEIPLKGRILLAEDGRDNQRLISTHLRASGAEVVIAENGQLAIELTKQNSFDLILMDMQMPVMDGYTASAELRRQGFTPPIIAITAYAMAEDRSKCLESGCTDYLSKPIERDYLLKTVSKYLGQGESDSQDHAVPAGTSAAAVTASSSPPAAAGGSIRSSLIDYPGMKPIITEFVDELPQQVQKMTDLLADHDMNTLRRMVHQLRGAGGGYGFDPITAPATRAEEAILASKSLEEISDQVNELIGTLHQIEGFDPAKVQSQPAGKI